MHLSASADVTVNMDLKFDTSNTGSVDLQTSSAGLVNR